MQLFELLHLSVMFVLLEMLLKEILSKVLANTLEEERVPASLNGYARIGTLENLYCYQLVHVNIH